MRSSLFLFEATPGLDRVGNCGKIAKINPHDDYDFQCDWGTRFLNRRRDSPWKEQMGEAAKRLPASKAGIATVHAPGAIRGVSAMGGAIG